MPRLLIVSLSHNPRGGADRIVADLGRELPSRGWETVLGLTRGATFNSPSRYTETHTGLKVVEIDGTLGTRASRLKALTKVIRRTSPDVILSMRVFDVLEVVSHLKSVDVVSAPRFVMGIRAFESPYLSDLRQYRHNIDFCVTSGHLIADACHRWAGLEANRVESIGGGVAAPRTAVRPRTPTVPVRILYAGRLEQVQKRVLDLIDFVRCLKKLEVDFQLDICGSGDEEPVLVHELAPEVSAGKVRFHGWVSEDHLYSRFYPNADVFVHFAAWEGITISPREAMIHGVVPVISEFSGIYTEKQFLNGINSLLFPVGRPDVAALNVKRLISSPRLMMRLSEAAMESQSGRYSFDGSIDAWRDVFNTVISLPPKQGPYPQIAERLDGRLSRLGVPGRVQHWIRSFLNLPVRYADPGSEWPVCSGLMTQQEQQEIEEFGHAREMEKQQQSGSNLLQVPADLEVIP